MALQKGLCDRSDLWLRLLGGDTAMPGGLHAGLCHAFLSDWLIADVMLVQLIMSGQRTLLVALVAVMLIVVQLHETTAQNHLRVRRICGQEFSELFLAIVGELGLLLFRVLADKHSAWLKDWVERCYINSIAKVMAVVCNRLPSIMFTFENIKRKPDSSIVTGRRQAGGSKGPEPPPQLGPGPLGRFCSLPQTN